MAWDKGFDFRSTAAFVTDPTDCTYVQADGSAAGEIYPIIRNSVTFGWAPNADGHNPGNTRDRDNAAGHEKISGVQWGASGICEFQVDLPAPGDYIIDLALGDPAGGANNVFTKIYDGTVAGTLLATIGPTSNSSGQFVDASGVNRTSASDWLTNRATITKTFATSIFTLTLEDQAGSPTPISHLFLSQVGGGGGGGGITSMSGPGFQNLINRTYRPRPFAPGRAR